MSGARIPESKFAGVVKTLLMYALLIYLSLQKIFYWGVGEGSRIGICFSVCVCVYMCTARGMISNVHIITDLES